MAMLQNLALQIEKMKAKYLKYYFSNALLVRREKGGYDRPGRSLKGANLNNPGSKTRGKTEQAGSGSRMGANNYNPDFLLVVKIRHCE
ncbi:hypothetical protein DFO77_103195 [Marinilabilia salmonicolor]|jgi:hypothetical protein|uniref:Uncharacterized protein n=1 Tax=Marinilabilia salmonicolor TaxID=989 RepID=A0A2T0XME6_9BACT|nr:hypothetical protein BY457_107159 [Marinilabilia salmonicolor]RCW38723.1 hypothetical protein DFO77_103195 [Marinilabilia salmonicolor]